MSVHEKRGPADKDVIVIGAGASGLFCAAACGRRGRSVLVLDHAARSCSKVLVSGGGRCNFTNLDAAPEHYLSSNPHFCRSALARFTPRDILGLAKKHGIPYYEKEAGQLFCVRTSRDIAAMLARECSDAGVELRLGCAVSSVERGNSFLVRTDQGTFASESLVIATGGLSYPKLGASGFGYDLARQFGLGVVEPRPALVPFLFTKRDRTRFSGLAGISFEAAVNCGGRTFRGGILFTHRGLSGPAALQASSFWKQGSALAIDLLSGTDIAALFERERQGRKELRTVLGNALPKRLAETLCGRAFPSRPMNQLSDKDLRSIAGQLHAFPVAPAGTEGYDTAEVTAGGVDTRGISSKTMEARDAPGLFFIGEVLDVTGELGGYNLHWAWASGRAAGEYA